MRRFSDPDAKECREDFVHNNSRKCILSVMLHYRFLTTESLELDNEFDDVRCLQEIEDESEEVETDQLGIGVLVTLRDVQ